MKVVDDRHKNHKTNDSTVERGRLRQCICSYSYPINFCNDIVRVSSSWITYSVFTNKIFSRDFWTNKLLWSFMPPYTIVYFSKSIILKKKELKEIK